MNAPITVGAITFTGANYDLNGSNTITLGNGSNGTILVNQSATIASTISVPSANGQFQIDPNSTATLYLTSPTNTFGNTNGILLNGGTLNFTTGALGSNGTGNVAQLDCNGGTLQWATGNSQDVSGQIHFNSATIANLDTQTNNVTFNSAVGGVGGLTKLGAGSLTLTQINTYAGGTTVSGGSLGAVRRPPSSAGR